MATATEQPQVGLEDNMLEDSDLLAVLERMQKAKVAAKMTRSKISENQGTKEREAKEAAEVFMQGLELEDDVTYRCGQFQIVPSMKGGTDVSFTTEKKRRFAVKVIGE